MLVPFIVEPKVFSGERHWAPRDLQAHLNSFMRNWKQIGLLVYDGNKFTGSRFWKAVEQKTKTDLALANLRDFVHRVPKLAGDDKWSGVLQETDFESLAKIARVCVTSSEKMEELLSSTHFELRSLGDFADAAALVEAQKLSNSHINKGESTQSVWDSRFAVLATPEDKCVKNISIVDRFTVQRQLLGQQTELHNFLRYLGRSARSIKNVTVYSMWPYHGESRGGQRMKKREINEGMRALSNDTDLRLIGSLTLRLFDKDSPKDRFVAFGENYLWDLGHGLEPFVDEYALKDCSATFKTWDNAESYRKLLNDWRDDEFMIEIWKNRS